MASVIIIGDGPGGLSAALFLAKNGHDVIVYGEDQTAMHWAYLYNYLGIREIAGSDLQTIGREQVLAFGGRIVGARVSAVTAAETGFTVTLEDGTGATADYIIFSEGKSPELAGSLGLEADGDGIVVDRDGRTSLDGAYAIGRTARPKRSQAIISAGAGAVAALDILARVAGKDVQDWDSPPKDEQTASD